MNAKADLVRSSARTERKQVAILNAATSLFLERGYDAVTLDDILERVGGSKTTLYSYYGGKEGLFFTIVKRRCSEKLAPFQSMDVVELGPKAGLNALGRAFLSIISDPQGRAMFRAVIAEAQRFPELAAAFFASGPETATRVFKRSIEAWQKQGALRPDNSEALAIQFMGILMGNFHLKNLLGLIDSREKRQINSWVTRGVDLFLKGCQNGKA
jgi:AcrR family transcriptional regulator